MVGVGVIVAVGVRLGVRVAVGEWVMVGVLVCVGMIVRIFVGRLEAVGCGVCEGEGINATGCLQPVMSSSPMTIIPWRMQHWREKMEQVEADREAVRRKMSSVLRILH